jgi:hypothetical protein
MTTATLAAWLGKRVPDVPGSFLPHLLRYQTEGRPTAEKLAGAGADAIANALGRPGRDREAAFALLAGDALLTYSCEALAEAEGDVGEALETIIQRLGTRFP